MNLSGIELEDLRATRIVRGGFEQLRVEGTIVSVAGRAVPLPLIEVVLFATDGAEIGRRAAVAAAEVIAPGGAIRFATDIPDLPAEATSIVVHFGDDHTMAVR